MGSAVQATFGKTIYFPPRRSTIILKIPVAFNEG
jgi:hypothetical protein